MSDYLQVFCTAGCRSEAEKIAEALVEQRLAACAQIAGPITSIFRWEGEVEHAEEWLLLMKTTVEAYPAMERVILEMHSYDTPEITAVPIERGSAGYLQWLDDSVARA